MEAHNLLIVSDLHLSDGLDPQTGKLARREDFLFDDAFARFLRYHQAVKGQARFRGYPWKLIVDGDLFDFLQVERLPAEGRPLLAVKGVEQHEELRRSERRYGLGTAADESVWKLRQISRGHQRFFAALGWFLVQGNSLAVVKGNHDVDLHWPEVRERFVKEVQRAYARERRDLGRGEAASLEDLAARVEFHPWFYCEPGWIYVEHGCQYEAANCFRDPLNPVLADDPERIELPWGSLFVRYLFNEIEDVHPFVDNVKPITRYVGWAFRTDPIGTIELLATRGGVFLMALWKTAAKTLASARRRGRERKPVATGAALSLPPEAVERIAALSRERIGASWQQWLGSAVRGLLFLLMGLIIALLLFLAGTTIVTGLGWATAIYLLAAAVAYFLRRGLRSALDSLFEDRYLLEAAHELEQRLKPDHSVRYIVMGHDHRAGLERLERSWYVNTGAWVPLYEEDGPIEGRAQLTFFRLARGYEGTPELLYWDDAAGAPARVILRADP